MCMVPALIKYYQAKGIQIKLPIDFVYSMNRREFLQRLLEQTDYSHYSPNKKDDIEFMSPPTTVKRMQIMQLGCPRIKAPLNNKQEQPLVILKNNIRQSEEKHLFQSETAQKINVHVNANNKRVFVLQKIKHERKKKDSEKKINERPCDREPLNYDTKKNPDITQEINSCLAKQRVSIDSYHYNQTSAQNTKGLHMKTSSESQVHRAPSYSRKDLFVSQSKKCPRQCSDSGIKQEQTQAKDGQEKTNRSEAKSMFIKSTQYSSNSSFGPRKQRTIFRHKEMMNSENKNDKEIRQQKMTMRRELHKNYTKQFSAPPKITAKCYIVIERLRPGDSIENKSSIIVNTTNSKLNHKIHASFNSKSCVQVASLTKIMTCIVAIQLCLKYRLDSHTQIIKVGKFESNIGGTSAKIQQGDIYSLHDLLHGLMLPSGNDASLAIAVWGGKVLYGNGETGDANMNLEMLHSQRTKKGKKLAKKTKYYEKFLAQMNKKAKELKLAKTNYANSHGLINNMNKSCAYDISVLSLHAMQNQYFRQIVSTKTYAKTIQHQQKVLKKSSETTISTVKRNLPKTSSNLSFKKSISMINVERKKQVDDEQSENEEDEEESSLEERQISVADNEEFDQFQTVVSTRQVYWQNTHKLLHKPNSKYIGIKTGVTTAAGPCLSSCIRTECGRQFYIVVLNCKKMLLRFKDTDALRKWVFKQQNLYKAKAKGDSVKSYSCVDSEFEHDEDENQLDED